MKKKIILFILLFIMPFSFINDAKAIYNGAGSVGAGGGSMPGAANPNWYYQYEVQKVVGAYFLRVIYSNGKNANWEFIGKPLVVVTGDGTGKFGNGTSFNHRGIFKAFANAKEAKLVYGNDNKIVKKVADTIFDIERKQASSSDLTTYLDDDNMKNGKILLSYMGISNENIFTKQHFPAKKSKIEEETNYGKPGYRLVVEKIISVYKNGALYATTRKSLANEIGENDTGDDYGFWRVEKAPYGNTFYGEIYTEFSDINVRSGKSSDYNYANFRSYNNGVGLHIYDLKFFNAKKYDYYPDSLCTNCDSESSAPWTQIYTDTGNWDAIAASFTNEKESVKEYFNSGKIGTNDIKCREEVKVKFPNERNKILVEPGRYFTVGLPQKWRMDVPNFEPLNVEWVRECRAYAENTHKDVTNQIKKKQWTTYWKDKSKDTGTIKLKYKELKGSGKYNKTFKTDTYNQKISGANTKKLTVSNSYKLIGTTYRYVRVDNGLSVSKKPDAAHTDLGVANLPVSHENKGVEGSGAANLEFIYTLPKNSHLTKVFNPSRPSYFGKKVAADDIYNKAKKAGSITNTSVKQGSLTSAEFNELKKTSCVMNYCNANGKNCTSEFIGCVNGKIKAGGKTQTTCSDYVCKIKFGNDEGNSCRYDENTGKYYINNEEVTLEEYEKNGCRCKIVGNKYYLNMKEVTKEEYENVCPPSEKECPTNDPCCLGTCKPLCKENEEDCKIVIYRTIDLNQPFPGYNAENRKTGANWCGYDEGSKKIICDGYQGSLNNVVDSVIFKNRGVTGNPESVYSQEPLYEVELDARKINSIRDYNKDNKYSDFTLDCDTNDATKRSVCKMSDNVEKLLSVRGKCVNSTTGNFYDCEE